MSFVRDRIIGTDTVFNDTTFISIDISGDINLANYATTAHLETNTIYVLVHTIITDEATGEGAGFYQRFSVFYDANYNSGSYFPYGIVYSETCPVYLETFSDGVFEWSTEGTYPSFSGNIMNINASIRSITGIDLRIRSYIEIYVNSNVL